MNTHSFIKNDPRLSSLNQSRSKMHATLQYYATHSIAHLEFDRIHFFLRQRMNYYSYQTLPLIRSTAGACKQIFLFIQWVVHSNSGFRSRMIYQTELQFKLNFETMYRHGKEPHNSAFAAGAVMRHRPCKRARHQPDRLSDAVIISACHAKQSE